MTAKYETLQVSAGRDYRLSGRYEYVVFNGEEIVARAGCFKTNAQAKRAGLKVAKELLAAS